MPAPDLSPVNAATVLAGLLFSSAVADIVGPYTVITIGAMAGTSIALLQGTSRGRGRALGVFVWGTFFALLLTVPLSAWAAHHFSILRETWLFTPMAIGLGYCADRLDKIFPWFGEKIAQFVDVFIARKGKE